MPKLSLPQLFRKQREFVEYAPSPICSSAFFGRCARVESQLVGLTYLDMSRCGCQISTDDRDAVF